MREDFMKLVSLELKIIRLEHNDLQEELALKSRVASSTISKLWFLNVFNISIKSNSKLQIVGIFLYTFFWLCIILK